MRLKELEIQGFKSFPDRTKITIGNGITGVVGPNGSGKSNISDAIRWVMGETSTKQLRGAGKMENVIFGGTQTRGAMGFASVSLTIDNTDHGLDMDADEVTIGRRYYRSGDSEYTINGNSVRLRDVYELLLDTGLGRDGYSIIGQGRIAEIVGAKSAERREIFEEAGGISRYRYRKNEAERRLAAAEDNLSRLRDILGELEGRVGPLERESKKAQQFLELSARRKSLEVTLWMDSIARAKDTVREQQHKYDAAQGDYNSLNARLDEFDAETERLRSEVQQLSLDAEDANARIRAVTEEQAGSESEIAVLKNEILHNRQNIDEANAELARHQEGRRTIEEERTRHEQAIAEIRATLANLDEELAELRAQQQTWEEKARQSGQRRDVVNAELTRLSDEETTARVKAAGAASEAEAAVRRQTELQNQQTAGSAAQEHLQQQKQKAASAAEEAEEAVTRLENIRAGLRLKLETRKKQLDEAGEAFRVAEREQANAQQRVRILEDLERNMDGYQQSVKSVMKAAAGQRLRGMIGPVAGILTVKKGYETAIETALGFALQNIVVENEASARAAISFLKEERAGRATFLPLDTVQGSRFTGELTGTAEVAADLVSADARYQNIINNLLGRIIVVEDLAEASGVARRLGYRNRVVTLDGQVINAGGSFTGGSTARSVGVFSRRQELDELRKKLEKLAQRRTEAEREATAKKAEVDNLEAQLSGADAEAVRAGAEQVRTAMELDNAKAALAESEDAGTRLTQELIELETRIKTARGEQKAAEQAAEQAGAEQESLRAELAELGAGDDTAAREREELSSRLSDRQMEHLASEKDISLHEAALQTLLGRTGEADARAEALRTAVAQGQEEIEAHRSRIVEIEQQRTAGSSEIVELEQKLAQNTQARMEKEARITRLGQDNRALTDEREKMSGEMARLSERRTAAEQDLNDTTAKLWEEYQLTEGEAAALCVEFDNVTELRRQVSEVRGRVRALGNVNVGAIDEYKEVKERYDFLKAQVTDVEKSKAELTRMIGELCAEMRELFRASFQKINSHFGQIFREMFGGGSARLYLSDENDVLESGIEIEVSPPGKVIRNLTALSGGEQALVAISIYFAILEVNPSPFCILDEIEAALDDVNVARYAQYLRRMTDNTQFVVITHRRGTMEAADVLYGVTMQEDGVSKILKLDLENVSAELVQ